MSDQQLETAEQSSRSWKALVLFEGSWVLLRHWVVCGEEFLKNDWDSLCVGSSSHDFDSWSITTSFMRRFGSPPSPLFPSPFYFSYIFNFHIHLIILQNIENSYFCGLKILIPSHYIW